MQVAFGEATQRARQRADEVARELDNDNDAGDGCDAPAAPAHAPLLEAAGAPVAPGPSAAGPPGDAPAAALAPALAAPVAPAPARRLRKKTTVDLDSKPVNVDGPEAPKKKRRGMWQRWTSTLHHSFVMSVAILWGCFTSVSDRQQWEGFRAHIPPQQVDGTAHPTTFRALVLSLEQYVFGCSLHEFADLIKSKGYKAIKFQVAMDQAGSNFLVVRLFFAILIQVFSASGLLLVFWVQRCILHRTGLVQKRMLKNHQLDSAFYSVSRKLQTRKQHGAFKGAYLKTFSDGISWDAIAGPHQESETGVYAALEKVFCAAWGEESKPGAGYLDEGEAESEEAFQLSESQQAFNKWFAFFLTSRRTWNKAGELDTGAARPAAASPALHWHRLRRRAGNLLINGFSQRGIRCMSQPDGYITSSATDGSANWRW